MQKSTQYGTSSEKRAFKNGKGSSANKDMSEMLVVTSKYGSSLLYWLLR